MEIKISPEIRELCPNVLIDFFEVPVKVAPSSEELIEKIDQKCVEIQKTVALESISSLAAIAATRDLYRNLGKKPGRYRSSAEALLRRVVTGKGLYHINNVVDLANYISISTNCSVGAYDLDKLEGMPLLGIGLKEEPYEAIARGSLNIANLPVLRDDIGAFGSPTSDSVRTMVDKGTKKLLFVFYNFEGNPYLIKEIEHYKSMFYTFCDF